MQLYFYLFAGRDRNVQFESESLFLLVNTRSSSASKIKKYLNLISYQTISIADFAVNAILLSYPYSFNTATFDRAKCHLNKLQTFH